MSKIKKLSLISITGLLVFLINHSLSADQYIDHVALRYEKEETFKRISEYFTNTENYGFRVITRSQKDERAGFYWILSLKKLVSEIPEGSTLHLQYYTRGDTTLKTHTFDFDTNRNSITIYAGITGSDWPDPKQSIDAWKIELRNASGYSLESKQSYLWAQPK